MLGLGNSFAFGIMLAYLNLLSAKFDRSLQYVQFVVFIQAVPIVARFLNATFFIRTAHYIRLFNVVIMQLISYFLLIISMIFFDEDIGILTATAATVIFAFAKVIGEATIVGFLKALPQELIATYGMGTGLSDCFSTCI